MRSGNGFVEQMIRSTHSSTRSTSSAVRISRLAVAA